MRPNNLKTKIFLDSGDPEETKVALSTLGYLDGQTTNPSLVFKNPEVQERLKQKKPFTLREIHDEYKKIISQIAQVIPEGSLSIEVYADQQTTIDEMLEAARDMSSWTPHAFIKFPCTREGINAASIAVKEDIRVNMTLCFSSSQAAAVYEATKGTDIDRVYVSPFIGRLDDIGINGLDLISHIVSLYGSSDHHVQVLAASIRNVNHLIQSIQRNADIATVPLRVLKEWNDAGNPVSNAVTSPLKELLEKPIALGKPWDSYDATHPLTIQGIDKFVSDWKKLLQN